MSKPLETLIPLEEIQRSLATENPWWQSGSIPKRYAAFPRRAYYRMFMELVQNTKVNRAVVLMGPRRVGKTVLATHCIQGLIDSGVDPKRILYVSVDAPTYTNIPLEHFLTMFRSLNSIGDEDRIFVVFDEVQYLPQWERHLKTLVDRMPHARFIASGSAAAALKLASSESGAGRFTDFMLPPLTFAEYLAFIDREEELITRSPNNHYTSSPDFIGLNNEFANYINYGGYPEAVFSQDVRSDAARYIKNDVIEKVLLRDLPQLYGIQNIQELNKLFTALAYQTGQETSLEKLSSLSGITKPTILRYIEYLEKAFLLFRVKRIDNNAKSFQRERSFKVHLTNPSMRAALFSPVSQEEKQFGHLVETAILSQFFHAEIEDLYYARWKRTGAKKALGDHGEIDLVCCAPSNFSPEWLAEIKWSDTAHEQSATWSGVDEFCAKHELEGGGVLTSRTIYKEFERNGKQFTLWPTALYCYTVGKNTVASLAEHPRRPLELGRSNAKIS